MYKKTKLQLSYYTDMYAHNRILEVSVIDMVKQM